MNKWTEFEIEISQIDTLLKEGYEIEIDSPDGWVGVNFFIDKGLWEEYLLEVEDGRKVRCNQNHLFETSLGWMSAEQLVKYDSMYFLESSDKFIKGKVQKTNNVIPIVDINVNHENHRYYTNGISSHNTGVGKSLFMCHCAASNLTLGKNVLYITLEMAEERIAERIDANLLNIDLDKLVALPKESYLKKIERLRSNTTGKLIIKEYPTASANVSHFKHLLNELKLKKQFIPDIIYIDYLNICSSSRIKQGSNVNSYTYVKAIAEELRGLAVETKVPVISATQTTRGGYDNSDVSLTDTSECIFVDEKIKLINGIEKRIGDVIPGDQIISQDEYKTVMFVHHQKPKECVSITLKSGKTIIVSKDHVFPTKNGRKSVNSGLKIGDILNSR